MGKSSRYGGKEQGAAAVRWAAKRSGKPVTPEQFLAQRAAQINALRASRGLPAIADATEAIAWERNMRLGVSA